MAKKGKSKNKQSHNIEFSDDQIEIFARRMLPALRRYFADENVKREFEKWKKQQKTKTE